ncbi:hypothetical protein PNA2_0009 [Pyrococcus sp. NA2]|uniref:hypothetical protein n=1 Tax=Pyrococcus sp. (strain NA2) TaxID=342949 RepID=UPI000209AC90|nr:hypothetical protein [Pyrococcus sp. NA2]AEC50927.1 hypothetical protein PNA2_0009 [Pyrococcus sp. NA2]
MKVSFKRTRWSKIVIDIPDHFIDACKRFNFDPIEVMKQLFKEGITLEEVSMDEIKLMEKQIKELEEKLYELEGKWSSLRFRAYQLSLDNRNLAIQVSGLIAENRRLREIMNLPQRDFEEIEKLLRYYLNL